MYNYEKIFSVFYLRSLFMKIQRYKIFCLILAISAMLITPAYARVSMTLPQYIQEILLNNHSLKASVKNVEADYYSVLAAVGYQRPSTSLS